MGISSLRDGTLWFLGDTLRGATLVALDTASGAEMCTAVVDVEEVQFVGIGQSLDYDEARDRLVLSGLAQSANCSHVVYEAPASGCGPFTMIGTYGDGAYAPLIHASTISPHAHLFVTLALSDDTFGIGVIDLAKGGMRVIDTSADPSAPSFLACLHYDEKSDSLFGIVEGQGTQKSRSTGFIWRTRDGLPPCQCRRCQANGINSGEMRRRCRPLRAACSTFRRDTRTKAVLCTSRSRRYRSVTQSSRHTPLSAWASATLASSA